jgi:hypothetical protein
MSNAAKQGGVTLMDSPYQPLSFGQLVDRSFRLYRDHFSKLVLLSLAFFGPFYLLYGWLLASSSMEADNSIRSAVRGETVVNELAADTTGFAGSVGLGIFFVLMIPLVLHVLVPVAVSVVIQIVQSIYNNEAPSIRSSLKTTLKRFWPLFGNSLLYWLILAGAYFVIVIGLVVVFMVLIAVLTAGSSLFSIFDGDIGPAMIFFLVILYLAVILGVYAVLGYFMIRFGYYIPNVVMYHRGSSLSRSWQLTKGSYWRLFFVFAVLSLILTGFYMINALVFLPYIPYVWLRGIIPTLLLLVLVPLFLTTYAVTYFDLRVRREGLDLEIKLDAYLGADKHTAPANQGLLRYE